MTAVIKRAWTQWMVVPQDGRRGGIAVASRKAGVELCRKNGWVILDERS